MSSSVVPPFSDHLSVDFSIPLFLQALEKGEEEFLLKFIKQDIKKLAMDRYQDWVQDYPRLLEAFAHSSLAHEATYQAALFLRKMTFNLLQHPPYCMAKVQVSYLEFALKRFENEASIRLELLIMQELIRPQASCPISVYFESIYNTLKQKNLIGSKQLKETVRKTQGVTGDFFKQVHEQQASPQIIEKVLNRISQTIEEEDAKQKRTRNLTYCALTNKIIKDPVQAEDGWWYEKADIEAHFKTSLRSPKTGKEIGKALVPRKKPQTLDKKIRKTKTYFLFFFG